VLHWLGGELRWVGEFCERLDAGHYRFADDPAGPDRPVDGVWLPAVLDAPEQA
jgi:hypothetical protein